MSVVALRPAACRRWAIEERNLFCSRRHDGVSREFADGHRPRPSNFGCRGRSAGVPPATDCGKLAGGTPAVRAGFGTFGAKVDGIGSRPVKTAMSPFKEYRNIKRTKQVSVRQSFATMARITHRGVSACPTPSATAGRRRAGRTPLRADLPYRACVRHHRKFPLVSCR